MEFEDLEAWQQARNLVRLVYNIKGKLNDDFGLRNQIRNAAVSVMTNVAEGFERWHKNEKKQFYNIARASCGEVRSLNYVLLDADYINENTFREIKNQAIKSGKIITGLFNSTAS